MSAGKTHRKMSILRRNLSLRSRRTETATTGSKDDPVARLAPLPTGCANRDPAARQRGIARRAEFARPAHALSAIYKIGKVTAVLLFWDCARPGSLRFYGHEVDE